MPPWLSYISAAQRKALNYDSSRWVQLATNGIDDSPRVRTVVFRGWSDSYEMELITDKRSHKYHELEKNNNVEICWLFSRSKCQFRLRGTSIVDLGEDRNRQWDKLNNNAKLMWYWPNPGDKFLHKNKDFCIPNKEIKQPDNFILLKINITHVDQLVLNKPFHIRRRWIKRKDWIEERINP